MKQHRYRITVEHLADAKGAPSTHALRFEVGNHDDILAIVEMLRDKGDFPPDTAAAFAVGLKLFGEVMLEDKDNPLFATIRPQLAQFIKGLKASLKEA